MKNLIFLILTLTLFACSPKESWTDQYSNCIESSDLEILHIAKSRFDQVLQELYPAEHLKDSYLQFIQEVKKRNTPKLFMEHLLINETTRKMKNSGFSENVWQRSEKWYYGPEGREVYFINGFASVPTGLSSCSQNSWIKEQYAKFKNPRKPDPSIFAKQLLQQMSPKEFENIEYQILIMLELGFTPMHIFTGN